MHSCCFAFLHWRCLLDEVISISFSTRDKFPTILSLAWVAAQDPWADLHLLAARGQKTFGESLRQPPR